MNPEFILWPVVLLALFTLILYLPLSNARVAAVKSGKTKASTFKHNQGEPEESLKFNNAIRNQYETPVLFYAACLTAYVSGNATTIMIILAWVYLIVKVTHTMSHVTTNKLRRRRPIFMVSCCILILIWLVLAGLMLNLF
ncbi:MAG: MAPEG family protein [Rhizobiaceae bacterium]